ncbi:peptidylprolyl isomerase [Paenibacillus sp. HB172176]|uniref:peptidylprolyl isomerase n=1 Tax=Paenibacillus sp. HB172176 TaxID=2493690 RepID=UPI0014397AE1|nr:peptidylprolyl isomerase [Paenibacillus sp. HB172176]
MLHSTRKSAWRRSALLVIAAVLVMTVMAACGNNSNGGSKGHSLEFKGVDGGDVVATYKDGEVTQDEFDKYLDIFAVAQPSYASIIEIPQFQEMILQQYISYKILSARASEDALKTASADVDEQLDQYKQYKESDADLQAQVKEKGISDEDMATFLMLTSAVVAHVNSLVTDEDIEKAFDGMTADYAKTTFRHILVATTQQDQTTGESKELRTDEEALARAKEVKAKLDAGGSWDELAKEYSDDPGSADNGGQYEEQEGKSFVEEFKQALLSQELGKIGDPVQSDYGYHVILVEKRDLQTYDQLSDDDKAEVKNAAAYTYLDDFTNNEMTDMDVNITLPSPSPSEGADGDAEASPSPSDAEATDTPAATDAPVAPSAS